MVLVCDALAIVSFVRRQLGDSMGMRSRAQSIVLGLDESVLPASWQKYDRENTPFSAARALLQVHK